MERGYPEWDTDEETDQTVDEGVNDGVYRGVPPGEDVAGSEAQIGREELTRRLAGTDDKSSRAWKTARDTLTRYRSGRRRVGARNAARIRQATQAARRDQIRAARRLHVEIAAGWQTSRTLWLGRAVADLTGADLEDFLAAVAAGDTMLAVQIVADTYGLDPEFVMGIDDVDIEIVAEGITNAEAEGGSGDSRE